MGKIKLYQDSYANTSRVQDFINKLNDDQESKEIIGNYSIFNVSDNEWLDFAFNGIPTIE